MKPKRIAVIASNWPVNEKFCPNNVGMRAGLTRLGIPFQFFSCRPALQTREVIQYNPDLVIYALPDMIRERSWRREIRQGLPNATIVMWYGDYRDNRMPENFANCEEMDGMFISNDAQEDYYKRVWKMKFVKFLPLGCEPTPKPVYNPKFAFDFVFIGGLFKGMFFAKRAQFIADLKEYHNLTLINSPDPKMRANIYQAMPAIYSSSKISLDVSHFTDIQKYTSIRFWEIPAMWGFAMTMRWPGCEEFYPEDSRVYFDTPEELLEKKAYYLEHDDERKKMIEKAHAISLNHSYDKRFTQMFSQL